MPAARASLLDAAATALARRPWSAVRMVDVAAAAGVSRQTLYNEFGSKDGLARALVRREADGYLAGVERALGSSSEPGERLTATAEWTAAAARDNAVVRALLTGCWSERLPVPALAGAPSPSSVPAQRRADEPLPTPGDFLREVRDRAVSALTAPAPTAALPSATTARTAATAPGYTTARAPTARADRSTSTSAAELTRSCELVVRLALSCVAAPPGKGGMAELVRAVLPRRTG
ncbi:TetR/AcrR family transcriptional regulator [Streptomyces sp. NPDC040750]|uniref:TetR/AcrR family transcriptional regulator n=1 Tax=Streptomyces sp. NPDC040750 TaxID=3154491 RepID=UPI0033E4E25B